MLKEVTLETVSIEEAEEMAYDGKIIDDKTTENGYLCTFLQEVFDTNKKRKTKEKQFVVCCQTSSGTLYLSKRGTTFCFADAKKFPEKEVKTKVFFMNKKGNYYWKYVEV